MTDINTNATNVKAALERTEDVLSTAKMGLQDMLGANKARRMPGLQNVIVFGRAVTNVLQNLRSIDPGFDEWYTPEQQILKDDPAMRFFIVARNEILKEGRLNIATSVHIRTFDGNMAKYGPPPKGARGFFIGDQLGGSGWEVELPDGERVKYYVEIPAEVGSVSQVFADLPVEKFPELKGLSVDDMAKTYVEKLSDLVGRARARFIGNPGATLKPSHLRVVK